MAAPGHRSATVDLPLRGMSCAACAARGLGALTGVTEASVNLATQRAHVAVPEGRLTVGDLSMAGEAAGYVVPAVALDVVVALAPAAWSPQRRFVVAGVAATALAYLTHNPAAALLGGRAVPPDALWAWFPVALLAGAAAALLGLRIGTAARPASAS